MVAEGEWPKSDGDILYASEVNVLSRNDAEGITPTISGWTVNPTNLSNTTDEDASTATGIGTLVNSGVVPTMKWDLGENKMHNTIAVKFEYTSTAGGAASIFYCQVSEDNSTYHSIATFSYSSSGAESPDAGLVLSPTTSKFRYIKLSLEEPLGNTATLKVYEIRTG